jgi:hypothetical protein
MRPVGAGDKTIERHDHLENHFSIAHGGRDLPDRVYSSLPAQVTDDDGERPTTPIASGDTAPDRLRSAELAL